jgi:hypothetical protein
MDPNIALKNARRAAEDYDKAEARLNQSMTACVNDNLEAAQQLRSAFKTLDDWLSGGGFLPRDWDKTEVSEKSLKNTKIFAFTCNDHDNFWPVGSASVILAHDEVHARQLLAKALKDHGLNPDKFTLHRLETKPQAVILWDGDY